MLLLVFLFPILDELNGRLREFHRNLLEILRGSLGEFHLEATESSGLEKVLESHRWLSLFDPTPSILSRSFSRWTSTSKFLQDEKK